jgi:hypothetical protein
MDGNSTSQASKRLATIVAVLTFCAGSVGAPNHTESRCRGLDQRTGRGFSVVMDCPFNSVSGCGIFDAYSSSQIMHPIRHCPHLARQAHVIKSTQFIRAIRLAACNSTMQIVEKLNREMYRRPDVAYQSSISGAIWREQAVLHARPGFHRRVRHSRRALDGEWSAGVGAQFKFSQQQSCLFDRSRAALLSQCEQRARPARGLDQD